MIPILLVALAVMGVIIYYMWKTGKQDPGRKPQPRPRPQVRPEPDRQAQPEIEPPVDHIAPRERDAVVPADGFEDLDTPAETAAGESPNREEDEFVFVSTTPLNRQFYADLRNIENLQEQRRINILKTALEFNIIDKEDYATLLALKPGNESGQEGKDADVPTEDPDAAPERITPPSEPAPRPSQSTRPDVEELRRRRQAMEEAHRRELAANPVPAPAPAPAPAPSRMPVEEEDLFGPFPEERKEPERAPAQPESWVRPRGANGHFLKMDAGEGPAPVPAPEPPRAQEPPKAVEPLSDFDSDDWGDF